MEQESAWRRSKADEAPQGDGGDEARVSGGGSHRDPRRHARGRPRAYGNRLATLRHLLPRRQGGRRSCRRLRGPPARRAAAEGRRSTITLFAPDVLPTSQARRKQSGKRFAASGRDGRQTPGVAASKTAY